MEATGLGVTVWHSPTLGSLKMDGEAVPTAGETPALQAEGRKSLLFVAEIHPTEDFRPA